MNIGIDSSGKVHIRCEGDIALIPTELNGVALTAHELTETDLQAYEALPADRAGTLFDGKTFTALERPLRDALTAQIAALEMKITPRMLREAAAGKPYSNADPARPGYVEITAQIDELRTHLATKEPA